MNYSLSLDADFIDSEYQKWKSDPESVSREWGIFFEGFELAARPEQMSAGFCDKNELLRQRSVQELIYRYRDLGHIMTCLDPLDRCADTHTLLALSGFGLSEEDLDRLFYTPATLFQQVTPLRQIISALRETYCRIRLGRCLGRGTTRRHDQSKREPSASLGMTTVPYTLHLASS